MPSDKRSSRLTYILVPVALALALNGLIFALGWNHALRQRQPGFAPPGWAVGLIWTVLFALLGYTRWQATTRGDPLGRRMVTSIIVLCLAYPFVTGGLQDSVSGLIAIGLVLAASLGVAIHFYRDCRAALPGFLPLPAWLLYAGAIVIEVQKLNA